MRVITIKRNVSRGKRARTTRGRFVLELLEIFSRAKITWNLRSKRCSSGRFLRFQRGPSLWRHARSIGFYKPIVTMTAGTAWSMNCRNIFIVGRLTRSLPLSRPDGLPVYVARVPASPFCELRKLSELAQTPHNLSASKTKARRET